MPSYLAILTHVPPAMLVVFRLGGLMIYGPVFGSPVIPIKVKVFMCLILGVAIYPLIASEAAAGQGLSLSLLSLAPLIGIELLIGLVIGFLGSLPFVAVQTGGLLVGQQMGLGFAQFFNPAMNDEADVMGQMLFFMALGGFLLIGGHESMLLAVLDSFHHIPLGGLRPDGELIALVNGLLLSSLELALRIAAPLLALVFLESLAMGFIAKTVPQLNILSLGFPIRILIGLGVLAAGLVVINDVMMDGIDHAMRLMFVWVEER
jgi:flagellar biosynthetic protein FliR